MIIVNNLYTHMQNYLLSNFPLFLIFMISTTVLSIIYTRLLYIYAIRNNINDDPKSASKRKFQTNPVPLLGGTGACLAAITVMSVFWLLVKYHILDYGTYSNNLQPFKLVYVILAVLLMLGIGFLDDKIQLRPKWQFLAILAGISLVVFLGDVRISNITTYGNIDYWISILLTFTWLGFATASTKFLDGHDGLVASVGILNFLTIASIALTTKINQPLIFIFSMIWVFALSVFLFYNFPNATSYLGEGASEVIGFMIGTLAILSGAKVATALSILGWFIADIFLVWSIRIYEGRNPITSADRNHWHYRLLAFGLNKIQVLIITWVILIISSYIGLYGNTLEKSILILTQIIVLLTIYYFTPKANKNQTK
jgi:UDP-GlcNAc:undecaprenyl-phosphate/decaprenyl-phosphate GlcNAc-1-phosphate transferase